MNKCKDCEETRILINAALISLSFYTAGSRDERDAELIERMRIWVRDDDSSSDRLEDSPTAFCRHLDSPL